MWYDIAIKTYIDRENVQRNMRAEKLRKEFMKIFGVEINPDSNVYITMYFGKRVGVYLNFDGNLVMFKDLNLKDNTTKVSNPIKNTYEAGRELINNDDWKDKVFNSGSEFKRDILYSYPDPHFFNEFETRTDYCICFHSNT